MNTGETIPSDMPPNAAGIPGFLLGCFLACSSLAEIVQAQQVTEQALPQLQDVVVTARKITERLQDVPAAIITLSGEQLQNQNINDVSDLTRAVAGLNVAATEPNHLNLSIRGITSASDGPTVGFYIDDIPIDTPTHDLTGQYEPPIFDSERVEVLEGPQGSLYGGSAMGGAVKFVSRRPTFDGFHVDGLAEVATTRDGGISNLESVTANMPLNADSLALRVSVSHNVIGGYIDRVADAEGVSPTTTGRTTFTSLNVVNQNDINRYTVDGAKVALIWLPGAGVEVTPRFMYQQTRTSDASVIWPNLPRFESSFAIPQPVEDSFTLASLTVDKSFSFGDFVSISGFVKTRDATTQDASATLGALDPALATFADQPSVEGSTNTSVTQELRLSRNDKASRFGYVGGAYFRNLEIERFQTVSSYGSGATSETLPDDAVYGDHVIERVVEKSLFGEGYYRIGLFELTLGGRAYEIKNDDNLAADGIFNGGLQLSRTKTSQSGFSPKAEVAVKLSADNLVYALASKGFRIGGPVVLPSGICSADLAKLGLSAPPTSYGSDSLWNYEVGSKNAFAGGTATINVSAFYMDWSKLRQSVYLPPCGFGFTGNVGAAVSKGGELILAYKPIERLAFMAGVVYDNARITGAVPFLPAAVGDPVELAPRWVENLSADYSFPIEDSLSGTLHADFQNHGSQTQSFNRTIDTDVSPISGVPLGSTETVPDPSYLQRSYSIFNTSVGVRSSRWSARFIVQNAFNSSPFLNFAANFGYANTAYTLTPRTFRLAVDFRY
jgi:iron complex outermembrane recepter protein